MHKKNKKQENITENSNLLQSRLSSNRQAVYNIKETNADALKPNFSKKLFNSENEKTAESTENTDEVQEEYNPLDRLNRNIFKTDEAVQEELPEEKEQVSREEEQNKNTGMDMDEVTKIVRIVKETLKDDEPVKPKVQPVTKPMPEQEKHEQVSEPKKNPFVPVETIKKKSITEKILSVVTGIIIVVIALLLCRGFMCDIMLVDGNSMNPAYKDGDMIFVNKIKYQITSPTYGDMVILRSDDKYLVKRIVACPGDRVYISNGSLYVNGMESPYNYDYIADAGMAAEEISLNDDEYFVMGDNRNQSTDSRKLGAVNKNDIKGEAKSQLPEALKFLSVIAKKII